MRSRVRTDLHRSYNEARTRTCTIMHVMHDCACARACISVARDQRRTAGKKAGTEQTTDNRRQTTHRQVSFIDILADHAEPCSATVPRQHWAAEKQTWKLSPSFSPLPTQVTSARKQQWSPDIMVGRAACACALHPFLLCLEHDNGWVRWRTLQSYQQTLQK